jgi:hypothetical protein
MDEHQIRLNELSLYMLIRSDSLEEIDEDLRGFIGAGIDDEEELDVMAGLCRWAFGESTTSYLRTKLTRPIGSRLKCLNYESHCKKLGKLPPYVMRQTCRPPYVEDASSGEIRTEMTHLVYLWLPTPFKLEDLDNGRGPMPFNPVLQVPKSFRDSKNLWRGPARDDFMRDAQMRDWLDATAALEEVTTVSQ